MSAIDPNETTTQLTLEEIGLIMALLDELQSGRPPSSELIQLAADTIQMLRDRVAAAR